MKKLFLILTAFTGLTLLISCSKAQASAVADALSQEVTISDQETINTLESKITELENTLNNMKENEETQVTKISYEDSYIRITEPSDGSEKYLYNVTNVDDVKLTFKGEVSANCKSIRVLWAPESESFIQYHLEGRTEKLRGVYVDDFVLKQFKPGDRTFIYNVGGKLDNLIQGSNFYRFIATFNDGSQKSYSMTYYVYCGGAAEKAKPVIYLYPKKKQDVTVSVSPEGGVTESIPEMGKAWKVTAWPDGKIVEKKSKKEYPYLFWESRDVNAPTDRSEGFVVKTEELQTFFEQKLSILGLNEKEIKDFTEYWVPEMQGKPYVFVTFYSQERIDREAPLKVSPKPDSVIRVYFDHIKLDEPFEVPEQKLEKAERKGFAVVEWGGRRYK
ncbi:MAG: hypothetical protein IKI90_05410 [Treponema sp.]|nr:hypothetical protein [Treponema sp.]